MKRKNSLVIFGLFLVSMPVLAQSRLLMGYDKVPWGSTGQNVRDAYGLSDDIPLQPHEEDPERVSFLKQINVSDSIKSRTFMFIDGKLYRVWVYYNDTSDATAKNLQNILINRFGNRTDYDIDTGTTYLMFQQLRYTQETSTFGQYSPDLVVELIHTVIYAGYEKDTNNLLGQNQLVVCYTWKKFRDEYQASKLGL